MRRRQMADCTKQGVELNTLTIRALHRTDRESSHANGSCVLKPFLLARITHELQEDAKCQELCCFCT
jgi:hypothetical protein